MVSFRSVRSHGRCLLGDHGSASGSLFDSGSVSRKRRELMVRDGHMSMKIQGVGARKCLSCLILTIQFSGCQILTYTHTTAGGQVHPENPSYRKTIPRAESPALASNINEYVESTGAIICPRIRVHIDHIGRSTVDGRNPAPTWMVEALQIMG